MKKTEPLPVSRIAAQYDTRGAQRSRILLLGRTGMSAAVACTEGSDPNLIYTSESVGLVISRESPLPESCTLADIVLDPMATVATA